MTDASKNISFVMCHLSPVCHLSLMPTDKDPHFPNSSTMHSRLVCKDPKTKKSWKTQKFIEKLKKKRLLSFPILAICSSTRSLQFYWFQLSTEETLLHISHYMDIVTTTLNWPRGRFSKESWAFGTNELMNQ